MLEIRKKGVKNFEHVYNSYKLTFSDLRIAFNGTTQNVLITRENGAFVIKREGFNVTEVSVYDETGAGTEETFVNVNTLANRLIELGYIAFYEDGDNLPLTTENQIKGKRLTATVSATYNIDLNTDSDFHLTMSADTAFTFTNTPTGAQVRRCKVRLTGEFAATWTQAGLQIFGDDYDGTKWNDILVEMWIDGTIKGLLIYQQRETA